MLMKLTRREYQSYMLCGAVGLAPTEAAELMQIASGTVMQTIKKVKKKVNWHKASELSASAICDYLGIDYGKLRREILEKIIVPLVVLIFSFSLVLFNDLRRRRRHIARRRYETEVMYYYSA